MTKEDLIDILENNEFDLYWNEEEGREFRKYVVDLFYKNEFLIKENEFLKERQEWILCSKDLPKQNGKYLVTIEYAKNKTQKVISFATSLYDVDRYDFSCYKNEKHGGWYSYDSEWGFYENSGVVAWKPLGKEYTGG